MKRHEIKCKIKNEVLKEERILDKKIELTKLEIELKKLESSISINGNNNNVNINSNNTTVNIALDISQQRFDSIVDERYTFDVYEAQRIVDKVIMPFFCNEEGVNVATLTDRDRMILKILDKSTGKYVRKSPSDILTICNKSIPMKEKTNEYEDRVMLDVYGNKKDFIPEVAIDTRILLSDPNKLKTSMKIKSGDFYQK
jgi:hypothetical protein